MCYSYNFFISVFITFHNNYVKDYKICCYKQAFECYLAGIKPPLDQSKGVIKWTERHKSDFKRMVIDKELYLEVNNEHQLNHIQYMYCTCLDCSLKQHLLPIQSLYCSGVF